MKAIIFDLDDTLYDQKQPFREAYEEMFSEELDVSQLYLSNRRYGNIMFEKSQRGEMTMEEYYIYRVKNSLNDFGIKVTDQKALEFQYLIYEKQRKIEMSSTIHELLKNCHKSEIFMGIISNGPSQHQRDKVRQLGLEEYFAEDHIIVSGDIGIDKPDVRIFQYAQERWKLRTQDAWYIGDSFDHDMIGASQAGWNTIWFNHSKKIAGTESIIPNYITDNEEELKEIICKRVL